MARFYKNKQSDVTDLRDKVIMSWGNFCPFNSPYEIGPIGLF